MPRITPVDWKTLECVFKKAGFVFDRGKGDHRSYVKPGCLRPVVIPKYSDWTKNLRWFLVRQGVVILRFNAGVMKTWIRSSLRLFPVYLEFFEIPIITV